MQDRSSETGFQKHPINGKAIVFFLILFVSISIAAVAISGGGGSTIYYVDCASGMDSNRGKSPTQPWQTLERANSAFLSPGDSLLFKRGCTWQGTLNASWVGTSLRPILISDYGSGPLPVIENGPGDLQGKYYNNVDITGSYLTISYLNTVILDPPVDPGCQNNPVGFYVGFNFRNVNNTPNGGSYNTLEYSEASGHTAGVHLNSNTHNNHIYRNTLSKNDVMNILTHKSVNASDDIGAWGILVRGSGHEIAYNTFYKNQAWCTYDTPPQGNAIELYEAQNVTVHHNISIDDRVFSELGSSPERQSQDNTYAYNLVVSSVPDAHFIITRGNRNPFGPTHLTKVENNTVYFTGAESEGIVCGAGCDQNILIASNNIIWAEKKAIFADSPFQEDNNIFWSNDGKPVVQLLNSALSSRSMVIDPRFVDPARGDFHLQATSPGIDTGAAISWKKDLDCVSVPQDGIYDIGAYEYQSHPRGTSTGGWLGVLWQFKALPKEVKEDPLAIPICQ